jgi:hypothetical protein
VIYFASSVRFPAFQRLVSIRFFPRTSTTATLVAMFLFAVSVVEPMRATTVVPPDFDTLAQQADYVVRGTVKSVRSEWRETAGNRAIITFAEIDVREVIAGTPPAPLVLELLGGRVGEDEMRVHGLPTLAVGEEAILFVRGNGVQFSPLVALRHGHYPIRKDAKNGAPAVMRSDGSPLRDEKQVSLPFRALQSDAQPTAASATETGPGASANSPAASSISAALTPAEFAARIRAARAKAPAPASAPGS